VLVGAKGWLVDSLEKRASALVQSGQIRWLGYVPSEDLPILYAAASGFAFPSFYEGFGLPVLEAMASGIPVLTSNCSCLPEWAENVCIQVNPEDIPTITSGLERLLADAPFREMARRAGPTRAAAFSWNRFVDRTVAVYRQVI
jgi:alpha-1,3-rhamnosyl/mannosyltransferase